MAPFAWFKTFYAPKETYHTADSKIMEQLMEDRYDYRVPSVRFIIERIRTYETTGYPPYGVY